MKNLTLVASLVGLSTLLGFPAIAAVADAELETKAAISAPFVEVSQEINLGDEGDSTLLANHEPVILIMNESTSAVAYSLGGVSYRLLPGGWRAHYFSSYGSGGRYIAFDYSSTYGWQNQTYWLDLNSSFTFRSLGSGLVDLISI